MDSRIKRLTSLTAVILVLAIAQMSLPASLAESSGDPDSQVSSPVTGPQQATAILTTGNNKPILVNGVSTISGATVLTGAMIETPDQVGAAMSVPGQFTLDIGTNAKLAVEFGPNNIKIILLKGCVVLHVKRGTTGEIQTSRGVAAKADGQKDERLDVCDPTIATAPAAAAGGIGAGGVVAIVAALGGALALIPILTGGDNPSPGGGG